MKLLRFKFFPYAVAILFAIFVFKGETFAQFTVGISVPASVMKAPTNQFTVTATVTANGANITKLVIYRNDVPRETVQGNPTQLSIQEDKLGQDIYTYRARAYSSTGEWADSSEFKLSVRTPRILKMSGPGRLTDHTAEIISKIQTLSSQPEGGTLIFPCKLPPSPWNPNTLDGVAIYNISNTIKIPSNVTLQSEGFEEGGRCRIYWNDVYHVYQPTKDYPAPCYQSPTHMRNKPMFRIVGGTERVRLKDLWLYSRTTGPECPYQRQDWEQIAIENTVGVEIDTDNSEGAGNVKDVIFENVTITNFTRGISAISAASTSYGISDIKFRGYIPTGNHRQLYIDAKYAHNWDVQNMNIAGMAPGQGAIQIINAGVPTSYSGDRGSLRFLELNCNAGRWTTPATCVQVEKHGGLYFRQLHHEGVDKAIIVSDISGRSGANTNPDPIVFEASVATGEFRDASMKLYLVGNGVLSPDQVPIGLDDARLRFFNAGVNSTVVDCGDFHSDWTDIRDNPVGKAEYQDLAMLYSHAERNRASFFAQNSSGKKYNMPHAYCSDTVKNIGGYTFDTGVLPTEAFYKSETELQYSNVLDGNSCPSGNVANCLEDLLDYGTTWNNGGAVFIPEGDYTVDRTINIPRGSILVGATEADGTPKTTLRLSAANVPLFKINVNLLTSSASARMSGVAIRNIKLVRDTTTAGTSIGIAMVGENDPTGAKVGVSSDIHLVGLVFEGFNKGIYAGPDDGLNTGPSDPPPAHSQPMIDGISFKHLNFINNVQAVNIFSSNASNWNVLNLKMESTVNNALGWNQGYGGNIGIQNVGCKGLSATNKMQDCIALKMSSMFLNDFRKPLFVENALTIGTNGNIFQWTKYQAAVPTGLVIRNSDFSTNTAISKFSILGKAYITSMNNRYTNFYVGAGYEADVTRVTYCGDTYTNGTAYPGLAETHQNLWVWSPTKTRVSCGNRPFPFDDVVTLGGQDNDIPLVGNFYDDKQEDFVIYRPGAPAYFLIQQSGGTASATYGWGTTGDKPIIGRFFPNSRAQFGIFRESLGQWWINDPVNGGNNAVWTYGMTGDIPFTGNFLDEESITVPGNYDEIAVYRPSESKFYIINPRNTAATAVFTTTAANDSIIQVGDFKGLGYDQIAQFKNGYWYIVDPRNPYSASSPIALWENSLPVDGVPVAGRYFPATSSTVNCTQLGVWRASDQKFYVGDAVSTCGIRQGSLRWGSNNDFTYYPAPNTPVQLYGKDDIPLVISDKNGILKRPVAYRPSKGVFTKSIANGQWWVHDPIIPQ